ncbi:MAG TPA: hypothetical protein VHT96_17015 [Clostridia bacterium]|nr:hypothetical protein [Clostridia bacterium]
MFQKRILTLTIILLSLYIFTSCTGKNNEYISSAKEFNKIYFKTVKSIDTADITKSIEQLQTKENSENLKEMNELLTNIMEDVPKGKDLILENFQQRYNDLKFISDSYSKKNKLSIDDKLEIDRILTSIDINISNWDDKSSNINWQ